MIKITTGAPGNGKSLLVQSETIEEFCFGDRDIVTSTPVRVDPWVTGDGRVMLGLREFLRLECRMEDLPERVKLGPGVVAFGKMLVVEDEDQLGDLFMWRRDKKTGDWFKMRWDSSGEQFNAEDIARMRGGALVITDEAWKCYNSRRWKDTEKVVEFYGRQHRKFSDDWVIVSHSHKDLDVQLNRMTQSWRICMNYGLRRLGIFRQPALFEVKTYYEAPSGPNVRCFHAKVTRLNPKVCQTYDTSAGVAVGGGRAADVKSRKPGLSPWWALVGLSALIACILFVPGAGMRWFLKPFTHSTPIIKPAVVSQTTSQPVVSSPAVSVATNAPVVVLSTKQVDMVGYAVRPKIVFGVFVGKEVEVELSNGRRYRSGDGHLGFLSPEFCVIDGATNYFHERVVATVAGVAPASISPGVSLPLPSASSETHSAESTVFVIPHHVNSMGRVRSVVGGGGGYSQGSASY